jgi:predicted house-cleaning noncanonical NTP pyrophosphatase (MazG superfamily)
MEKLIRDNVPNIPHKEYTSMSLRYVRDTAEHIFFLFAKLDEEMDEFG